MRIAFYQNIFCSLLIVIIFSLSPLSLAETKQIYKNQYLQQLIIGELAFQYKNYSEAYRAFLSLAYATNNPLYAQYALEAAWKQNHRQKSIRAADLWLKLAPNEPEVQLLRAVLYIKNEQIPPAKQLLVKVSNSSNPFQENAVYLLGNIAFAEGDIPRAIKYYLAINSGPYYHEARIKANLLQGSIAYKQQDYSAAIKHLQQAYHLSNKSEIAALLGEVLWQAGNVNEAKAIWQKALEKTPANRYLLDTMLRYKQ